jgi:hypothetical protein
MTQAAECTNHGAHPVEYVKKGSEFRAWFCGGIDGCGQDIEATHDLIMSLHDEKPSVSEIGKLEFGCYVMASFGEWEHFRVLAPASICKKGHKNWSTCENNGCEDFDDGLRLFHDDEESFYSVTLSYEKVVAIMCPPSCDHRKK